MRATEARPAAPASQAERLRRAAGNSAAFVSRHHFVLLLLAATFLIRVFWAAAIPLFQAPDENVHFAYVEWLGHHFTIFPPEGLGGSVELGQVQKLVGVQDVAQKPGATQAFAPHSLDGPDEAVISQLPRSDRSVQYPPGPNNATDYPAGYYFLASLVYRVLSSGSFFAIVFGLRIFSALISTVTVLFAYLILKRFFRDLAAARATVLVISFLPMYAYMGAVINPDVLVWLLFAVFLYLLTVAFQDGLTNRGNLLIALSVAAGLWVKQTFLVTVPIYLLLLGLLLLKRTLSPQQALADAAVFAATLIVFVSWLYLGHFVSTSPNAPQGGVHEARSFIGFLRHLKHRWNTYVWTFDSAWGNFGWLDTPLPQRIYDVIRWASAAAAFALIMRLAITFVRRSADLLAIFYVLLSTIYVGLFIVINYLRVTSGEGWLLQGRYFFPAIIPVVGLLVMGVVSWVRAGPGRNAVLVLLVGATLLFQADALLRYVIPRYYL